MKLADFYKQDEPYESDFRRKSDDIVAQFTNAIRYNMSPCGSVKRFYESESDLWNLIRDDKKPVRGRSTNSLLVTSVKVNEDTVRLSTLINKYLKKNLYRLDKDNKKRFTPLEFFKKDFLKIIIMEAALMVAKYGYVSRYELRIAAVDILCTYFRIFDYAEGTLSDFQWIINSADVQEVIDGVDSFDEPDFSKYIVSELNVHADEAIYLPKNTDKPKISKPENADDYLQFFQDGMTVDDFVSVLREKWHQSQKTVYNYFKKFGINPKTMTKSNDLSYQINMMQARINSLEYENNKLREILKRNNISI